MAHTMYNSEEIGWTLESGREYNNILIVND